MIHRRDAFRASRATTSKIAGNEKMHYLFHSVVEEIVGDQTVKGLKVRDLATNEIYDYPVDGIFVFAGFVPNSELVKDFAQLDEKGYIVTNEAMHTSVPGLFAAGDVRDTVLRQVITAAADGAICGVEAENYIESMK